MLSTDNNNGITLTRGDSGEVTVTLTDASGNAYDASGDTVEFGVKRSVFDTECVLTKTVTDNKIVFEPDDTKDMAFGDYVYDVQITHVDDSGEEPVTSIWTPIAAARFRVGYNVL